jgi:TolB-like protein/Flp pilus assembly protein TadD
MDRSPNSLQLRLLGGFELRSAQGQDLAVAGRKVRVLLACLALSAGSLWPREKLMALLWSDRAEEQARASLRQALADLRRVLGEPSPLRTEHDAIGLDPLLIAVDAVDFARLAKAGNMNDAATLYRGPLLDGHGVHDGAFEDWLLVEGTRLHDLAIGVFDRLAASQSGEAAIETAQRLLQLDPTREETHRLLMRLYAAAGQRAQALRQYQRCRDTLLHDLQTAPAAETERLYRQIQDEPVPAPATSAAVNKAHPTPAPDSRPSIAVLPFANMSGEPEQEYFSDGITEDIITELSRYRSLLVIARNSSFQFRGTSVDMEAVRQRLGVRYVVEGSVRRSGTRLRITAQLIDAVAQIHLWAERFDRELADVFVVQEEVARRIVTSIAPVLSSESLQLAKRKPPGDMRAYDYFLRAKALVDVAHTSEELREGREFCSRAIQIDPTFARAHAYRSISYVVGIMTMEADDLIEWRKEAVISAEKAVALDAMDAVSHWALAEATFVNKQIARSRAELVRAIALNPNDADVLAISALIHACCGEHELASEHLGMAVERSPSNASWYGWPMGCVLYLAGRHGEALAAFDAYGRPNASIHRWRAAALVKLGRIDEARTEMQALLALRPKLTATEARKIFDYLPNSDDFVAALRQAGLPE